MVSILSVPFLLTILLLLCLVELVTHYKKTYNLVNKHFMNIYFVEFCNLYFWNILASILIAKNCPVCMLFVLFKLYLFLQNRPKFMNVSIVWKSDTLWSFYICSKVYTFQRVYIHFLWNKDLFLYFMNNSWYDETIIFMMNSSLWPCYCRINIEFCSL